MGTHPTLSAAAGGRGAHHKRALSPNLPACCISGQAEHGTYEVLPLSSQPPSVQMERACLLACCKEVLVVQSTPSCGAALTGANCTMS